MANNQQKLQKANKELREEVEELKWKLEKVSVELTKKTEECNLSTTNTINGKEPLLPNKINSVEFVAAK